MPSFLILRKDAESPRGLPKVGEHWAYQHWFPEADVIDSYLEGLPTGEYLVLQDPEKRLRSKRQLKITAKPPKPPTTKIEEL